MHLTNQCIKPLKTDVISEEMLKEGLTLLDGDTLALGELDADGLRDELGLVNGSALGESDALGLIDGDALELAEADGLIDADGEPTINPSSTSAC